MPPHPLYALELARLRRLHRPRRLPLRLPRLLLIALSVALYLWTLAHALDAPLPSPIPAQPDEVRVLTATVLALAALALLHGMLMVRVTRVVLNTLRGERLTTERWEALVLTGVSARTFVHSKVRAAAAFLLRETLLTGIARASLICWLGTVSNAGLAGRPLFITPDDIVLRGTVPQLVVTWLLLLALTFALLPFTAAYALLEPLNARPAARYGDVLAARFVLLLTAMPLCCAVGAGGGLLLGQGDAGAVMLTLIDGGLLLGLTAVGRTLNLGSTLLFTLRVGLSALALYGALTALCLWLTRRFAQRWGMVA